VKTNFLIQLKVKEAETNREHWAHKPINFRRERERERESFNLDPIFVLHNCVLILSKAKDTFSAPSPIS